MISRRGRTLGAQKAEFVLDWEQFFGLTAIICFAIGSILSFKFDWEQLVFSHLEHSAILFVRIDIAIVILTVSIRRCVMLVRFEVDICDFGCFRYGNVCFRPL